MTPLFLARLCAFWTVMHATAPEAEDVPAWRIVSTPHLHIGLRPAASWGEGAGLTLQITGDFP